MDLFIGALGALGAITLLILMILIYRMGEISGHRRAAQAIERRLTMVTPAPPPATWEWSSTTCRPAHCPDASSAACKICKEEEGAHVRRDVNEK